ncbi:hypothetical protein C8R47DRAFT_516770 [Mycena vitilis]|nr:hypothetical protein C8R47DRAFT_516770 [Mycena vitilis]
MATPNTVIVDDRDPLISYAGAWIAAGAIQEFNGTTMFSEQAGSTASLAFGGTSVTVYGTVAARNLSPQASWSFVVDGSISGTYTPPNNMTADIHHQPLWTSPSAPSLSNGSHTLVITQTAAATAAGVIFLDYIMYSTTATPGGTYFVDDRDARIQYIPAWRQFGSDEDFQHTSQESSSIGDRLSFEFEGQAISFYGGQTSLTANLSSAIDGGTPTFWIPPANAPQTNNLIFRSVDLAPGTHTLVVTAENDQPAWADYFLVTPNPADFVPPSSSSASASPSSSSASPSGNAAQSHKSTPVGAIVGPIVGVLALIALAAFIFVCRRRRHSRDAESEAPAMSAGLDPAPVSHFGAAGPPPTLAHGYSAYSQSDPNSPFVSPGETHAQSHAGPSGTYPYAHPGATQSALLSSTDQRSVLVASSHEAASSSNPNLISSPLAPSTNITTAPNSTASEGSNNAPRATGVLPSDKLLREARRYHVAAPSTSGSSSYAGGQEEPPQYEA